MRRTRIDQAVAIGVLLIAASCKPNASLESTTPRRLSDGSYAVAVQEPTPNWREYVLGSRSQEETAAKEQLLEGLSGLALETMRESISRLNVLSDPDPEHARLLSILVTIRNQEVMAKSLADSRRAAATYWPPLGVVVAPALLKPGSTARLLRRLNHDPTNILLISPSTTTPADVAVALTELRRLRARDGDVLFARDMEASFDVTLGMRANAEYDEYPRNVLEALLKRAPNAPVMSVEGIGMYPLDLFRIRSLSGKRP